MELSVTIAPPLILHYVTLKPKTRYLGSNSGSRCIIRDAQCIIRDAQCIIRDASSLTT